MRIKRFGPIALLVFIGMSVFTAAIASGNGGRSPVAPPTGAGERGKVGLQPVRDAAGTRTEQEADVKPVTATGIARKSKFGISRESAAETTEKATNPCGKDGACAPGVGGGTDPPKAPTNPCGLSGHCGPGVHKETQPAEVEKASDEK